MTGRAVRLRPEALARARVHLARTEEDLARAVEFFGTSRAREIAEGHPEERGCIRMLELDGNILAALLFDPRPLAIRGAPVPCARIVETAGEDGRRHFRETGEGEPFEFLLEEMLGYLWARSYPLAYAHGELALYPRKGFVPAFLHPRAYVDVEAALRLPAPYRVRRLKTDDIRRIPELRAPGAAEQPTVLASGVPAFHHFCVESQAHGMRGWFSLEVSATSDWHPKVFVPEVELLDREAACTVLRHCATEAARLELREIHFNVGAGHPLGRLCLELGGRAVVRGASADPGKSEELLCQVARGSLLKALLPGMGHRLARSAYAEENRKLALASERGSILLELRQGTILASATEPPAPDHALLLPDWQLTQLLAGYRGIREVEWPTSPVEVDILDVLLPKAPLYSLPDPDHWDDVPLRQPRSEEAEAVVRATILPWAAAPPPGS